MAAIDDNKQLFQIGEKYFYQGQYQKALECFEKLLQISPGELSALSGKTSALYQITYQLFQEDPKSDKLSISCLFPEWPR